MPPPRKLYPQDIPLPPLEYVPLDDADSPDTEPLPPPTACKNVGRLVWHGRTWFEIVKDPVELEYEDCEGE